jgi:hypothetical protein
MNPVKARLKSGYCMTEKNGRYCRFVADHEGPCFCTWNPESEEDEDDEPEQTDR